jgi:hypothetical protein
MYLNVYLAYINQRKEPFGVYIPETWTPKSGEMSIVPVTEGCKYKRTPSYQWHEHKHQHSVNIGIHPAFLQTTTDRFQFVNIFLNNRVFGGSVGDSTQNSQHYLLFF